MGRHQNRLLRYLRRLLGDETMAEDVFQQTWMRATERIRRYDASRPFGPWILTVGRNLALDHLRRRGETNKTLIPILTQVKLLRP